MAVLLLPLDGNAERARTPEARSFEVWVDDAEHLMVGIVETVPGTDEGVGFTIRCVRATGAFVNGGAKMYRRGGVKMYHGRGVSLSP